MNIYLDIETLPNAEMYTELLMVWTKDPDSPIKWSEIKDTSRDKKAVAKTALSGSLGRTYMIGFAVDDGPPTYFRVENAKEIFFKPEYREREKEMLLSFFDFLNTESARLRGTPDKGSVEELVFVGHNVIDFDLRFLWQRSVMLDIPCPHVIRSALNTRYPRNCYDTMREWSGFRAMVSLEQLCGESGIKYGGDAELGGADLFNEFLYGDDRHIASKNMQDVTAARTLYKRMSGRTASGV